MGHTRGHSHGIAWRGRSGMGFAFQLKRPQVSGGAGKLPQPPKCGLPSAMTCRTSAGRDIGADLSDSRTWPRDWIPAIGV